MDIFQTGKSIPQEETLVLIVSEEYWLNSLSKKVEYNMTVVYKIWNANAKHGVWLHFQAVSAAFLQWLYNLKSSVMMFVVWSI